MTAVLFLLRAVILVLLWGLVLAAVVAVRHDVFGTTKKAAGRRTTPAPAPAKDDGKAKRGRSAARRLVVTQGTLAGTTVPLAGAAITIGRADDSTLVLTDDYVSTKHARLTPQGDEWVLEDLGSTNGTYLGRQRIASPVRVPVGAPIRVGKTVLELRR